MSRNLYTIGFSKKTLREFVNLLKVNGVTRLVDTRLNNTSQLSGFAKKKDLAYIMELINISYTHDLTLAPSKDILSDYKKKIITWDEYEKRYIELLNSRKIRETFELANNETICFLCSEHDPQHCHRRILAEYLNENKQKLNIVHLY